MMNLKKFKIGVAMVAVTSTAIYFSAVNATESRRSKQPVEVKMFAPEKGHRVGLGGRGWFVDLEIEFDVPLAQTGFSVNADGKPGFQLTGPNAAASDNFAAGVHNNVNPFPGTFSLGADERIPGLIVLLTTTTIGVGPCHNVANLFNITGITDLRSDSAELWDTWIVGAPFFGVGTESRIFVAVAADLNGDGIFNDAPNIVPDVDGNGVCNGDDLKAYGIASNIESAKFFINP